MAGEFNDIISQADIDRAIRQVLEKYAPRIENILRQHIDSDIEGTTIPTATGGPWYGNKRNRWSATKEWAGRPYSKRHMLSGAVEHKIVGNTLLVSSTAPSDPSIINGSTISGWGAYLEFHEVGNMGLKGHFKRPAVTNAQKEVDKLRPEMEEEVISILQGMI